MLTRVTLALLLAAPVAAQAQKNYPKPPTPAPATYTDGPLYTHEGAQAGAYWCPQADALVKTVNADGTITITLRGGAEVACVRTGDAP
jgi:hypothetical protein